MSPMTEPNPPANRAAEPEKGGDRRPADLIGGFSVHQVEVWQGRFPPPDAVDRYEQVLPGAFDRIIRMAERQQETSIEAAREVRRHLSEANRRGQWLGWSVTVGAMMAAVGCAVLHEPWVAAAIVAVPVMGVAKSLIENARDTSPSRSVPPAASERRRPQDQGED
jgi:uncharacterized membrane protein